MQYRKVTKLFCTIISFCAILLFTACATDNLADSQNPASIYPGTLTASVSEFKQDGEDADDTRSSLTYDNDSKTMLFSWEEGDKLMLMSKSAAMSASDNMTCAEYKLKSFVDDNTAVFSGGGFRLSDSDDYFAFTPYDALIKDNRMQDVSAPVELSYEGQTQTSNYNSDHIGNYDFMTSMSCLGDDGRITFGFSHLSAVLRIKMKISDDDAKKRAYKALTLYTADNYDFRMSRTVSLIQDAATSSDYHPSFISGVGTTDDSYLHTITLNLGENGEGIVPDDDGILCMYLAIPASSELYNDGYPRTIYADVTPVDDTAPHYNISFLAKDYVGGTCYTIGRQAVESGKATLQVYVDRAWQHGSVCVSDNASAKSSVITRSALPGDPGYDDQYDCPTKLTVYLCIDGHPMQKQTISDIPASYWKENGTKLQYTQPIYITLPTLPTDSVRAYVIASNDLEFNTSSVSLGSDKDEETVRDMTFSFKSSSKWDTKQQILKNLYSTPYVEGSHNGLSTDLSNLNLIACLYHVACKIDLNWEMQNEMKLAGCTIKNLLKEGSIFLPADNADITSGGDTYSPSLILTNKTNGRACFFTAQQKDSAGEFPLSVSITKSSDGDASDKSAKSENVKFTLQPSFNDGMTSWFRINTKW